MTYRVNKKRAIFQHPGVSLVFFSHLIFDGIADKTVQTFPLTGSKVLDNLPLPFFDDDINSIVCLLVVVGILDALVMYLIEQSNQPVRVYTPMGSGYMTDGWGDALPMFNAFIVIGIIMAAVGLIMLFAAKKD